MSHPGRAGVVGISVAFALSCGGDGPTGPTVRCGAQDSTLSLPVGGFVAVDPRGLLGCIALAANPGPDTSEYLLVAQSVAATPGVSSPFVLQAAGVTAAAAEAVSASATSSEAARFDRFLRGLAASRHYASSPPPSGALVAAAAAGQPPTVGTLRQYKVCSKLDCTAFRTVTARASTVGSHVAVFVDTLAPAGGLTTADLDTLATEFDGRLYPVDTLAFGRESDVDANGVVIVLLTPVVNALVSASRCTTAGFVAGFFFAADLDPAFRAKYNNGEVFYAITADSAGTVSCPHSRASVKALLPVTFVHEFQHMLSFVQHVLVHGGDSEEGWLDEGLSKYAEELAGRSYLPDTAAFSRFAIGDVYDASLYLSAPGDSPLLIPFDNGTLADVGASWLFTRFVVDQFGDSVAHRLHESALTGAANVAAATGGSFDDLVERWGLANWVSDLPGFATPPELQYTTWHFRSTYASLHAQDPQTFPQAFPLVPGFGPAEVVNLTGTLRAGSGSYVRVFLAPGAPAAVLMFTSDDGHQLPAAVAPRLTVVRVR